MTEPLTGLRTEDINPKTVAMFLDFDGTLAEIVERPELVVVTADTQQALGRLTDALGGAMAVVTGRDIIDVDRFLEPLCVPVAGLHGLERRDADGRLHGGPFDTSGIDKLRDRLRTFVDTSTDLLLENKPGSIALHYRGRPDLETLCIEQMDSAAAGIEHAHLVRGKMVIEAKADASNKGDAVAAFLTEPPFVGRTPLFAGDDVTDEDAFREVNARNGISIKVGLGRTSARYRATSTAQFLLWLQRLADRLVGGK